MNASEKIGKYQEVKLDVKIKLAGLWIALMFCYTYGDILGFYAPGNLEQLLSGAIAGIQMTPGLLFGSAVLMVVPILMIMASLVLKAKVNRVLNIIAGILYIVVLGSTFFTGMYPAYYLLLAATKASLLGMIVWQAWSWPQRQA